MTKEEAYDQFVSPLMTQIIAVSKEHDIPMVAVFEITDDRSSDDKRICSTSIAPQKDICSVLRAAHSALYPLRQEALAITVFSPKDPQ